MWQASKEVTGILDRITDGLIACDYLWRITYMNQRAAELISALKKSAEESIGKTLWEEFPDLVGTKAYHEYNRAMSEQTPVSFEFFYPPLEGWFEVRAYPSADGLSVLFQDITERKQAEETLKEQTQIALLTADVGVALTQGDTLNDMLRRCCEAVVTHLGAAFARIWTLNEQEKILELQASAGMYTHIDGPHGRVPVGKFKIGLIAEERQPHLTNSVTTDPRVGDKEWAKREGMVAFAGYPLIIDDRLVGVMAMFSRSQLSEFTLDAMGAIAQSIALGIGRKKSEEERTRLREEIISLQAARLEELSTPIIPLSDRVVVMPLIGSLDAQRAERLITALSNAAIEREAQIAIIDITGVSTVDTQAAAAIIQAAKVLRLLGAEAVLTGIRPAIAQTLVQLGIDLTGIISRNTLQNGIDYARERLNAHLAY